MVEVCVVILDYRGASKTELCLRSLVGQGVKKVLVVDNSADADASRSLAAMVEGLRAEGTDFDLQVINTGTNLGFARGVNFALASDGRSGHPHDAYLLLNNDAIVATGMVSRLAAALTCPGTRMAAPVEVDAAGKLQPMFWYQRYSGLLTTYPLPGSFPYLSGCCLLVQRDMLEDGKLFDEDFFMYGEDMLLGWRLARAGKVLSCVNDAVVRHSSGGSSRQGQFFYEYHMTRAHILLALKTWRSPFEIPLLLVSKSMVLALRALRRCARYGSGVPLLAYILAWFPMKIRVP